MCEATAMLEVQPIIRHLAKRLHRQYPQLDVEELVGEGQIAALKAIRSHDPAKTKTTTWVWRKLVHFYWTYVKWETWHNRMLTPAAGVNLSPPAKDHFSLRNLLLEVSTEAAEIVNMVLQEEINWILSGVRGPKKRRRLVVQKLSEAGWQKNQIDKAFTEIQEALS